MRRRRSSRALGRLQQPAVVTFKHTWNRSDEEKRLLRLCACRGRPVAASVVVPARPADLSAECSVSVNHDPGKAQGTIATMASAAVWSGRSGIRSGSETRPESYRNVALLTGGSIVRKTRTPNIGVVQGKVTVPVGRAASRFVVALDYASRTETDSTTNVPRGREPGFSGETFAALTRFRRCDGQAIARRGDGQQERSSAQSRRARQHAGTVASDSPPCGQSWRSRPGVRI